MARFLKGHIRLPIIIACAFFLLLVYSLVEPYLLKTTTLNIVNKSIPDQFNNVIIVFAADIHHGPYFSINRVKKFVNRINALNPDIVLLGGDYVHRDIKYISPVFEELSKIKFQYFIGGVLGNHDHWESKNLTYSKMKEFNIKNLDNNSYWISKKSSKIKVGGVGDLWEDKQSITGLTNDVSTNDFVILLSHNPDYFQKITTKKIDLVLSGHTHGGQITFFGFGAPLLPIKNRKFWKGRYTNNFSELYITSGVGTITPPVRFFCRPEIVKIVLHNNLQK